MFKDNQVSTFLLLCVLGFLIWYLNKPATTKLLTKNNEHFVDAEVAPAEVAPTVPEVVQPVPVAASKVDLAPVVNEVKASPEVVPKKQEESEGVFNFQDNDINMDMSGADLDVAFARPIPPSVSSDIVDVNKNNVKKYDAKDFLPKEINNKWFDTDISQAKYNVNDDKLINTERYVIGINTVGQSLKNASYDIRGTVPNPKFSVSPWNNSTIEADYNLKSLC
jgi:hypothetical protein